jgi:hypothetical protein
MLLETILVTRLLQLVAGPQTVAIETGPAVQSVQLVRNGETVATLREKPYVTQVDFGPDLMPHELTVMAFDANGSEVARETQAINLARSGAELAVLIDRDEQTQHVTAHIHPRHVGGAAPVAVAVTFNGQPVGSGRTLTIPLGAVEKTKIHTLSAQVRFADGVETTQEVVFGGVFGEEQPSELTHIAVRQTGRGTRSAKCFQVDDRTISATAVEKGKATVFVVQNGSSPYSMRRALFLQTTSNYFLIDDTDLIVVSPRARDVSADGGVTQLFEGKLYTGHKGLAGIVLRDLPKIDAAPVTDAVGSTVMRALRDGRRAVVLLLGAEPATDTSVASAANVRRYAARVGVPLHVWSLTGVTPELEAAWGEVEDVSVRYKLLRAVDNLREELDGQRVAWLPLPPFDAYRAVPTDCGKSDPASIAPTRSGRGAAVP